MKILSAKNVCGRAFAVVILLSCSASQAQPITPKDAQPWGRMISLLLETGDFQTKWDTIGAAREGSAGNAYNQTLKLGSEIIILNSRCEGEVSYSVFALSKSMMESANQISTNLSNDPAGGTKSGKLVASFLLEFEKSRPAKPSDCEPIPVEISFANRMAARIEHDDVGSPLVGGRLNDAYIFEATRLGKARAANKPGSTELTGGVVNGFTDIKAATFAASQIPGAEIAVKGKKIYLYRVTGKLMDFSSDDAKLAALKAAKPAKGRKILALIMGSGEGLKVLKTD